MAALKVVFDTNVLLSAALGGRTRHWLEPALKTARATPILSPQLLREVHTVLQRPEFGFTAHDLNAFLLLVHEHATIVVPTFFVEVCRDPKDNLLLDCALAAHADAIVTGDRDLLTLHPFRQIPIVSPKTFVAEFLT